MRCSEPVSLRAGRRASIFPGKRGHKHDGPIGRELPRFRHEFGKGTELVRNFIHGHQRHERTALSGLEIRALLGRAILRHFRVGKYKQQALRLGLRTGGADEIVKIRDVHGHCTSGVSAASRSTPSTAAVAGEQAAGTGATP